MQKLFENWRRYLNESTEPDHLSDEAEIAVHPEADVEPEEQETSDEQKLFNTFLDNGAHGLHLAEMVGSPIAKDLHEIVRSVRHYISLTEKPDEVTAPDVLDPKRLANSLDWSATSIGSELYSAAEKILDDEGEIRNIVDEFEEMVIEAGDYVWWHGEFANKSPNYNIASKERSSTLLDELKSWAGV